MAQLMIMFYRRINFEKNKNENITLAKTHEKAILPDINFRLNSFSKLR